MTDAKINININIEYYLINFNLKSDKLTLNIRC